MTIGAFAGFVANVSFGWPVIRRSAWPSYSRAWWDWSTDEFG